MSEYKKPLPSLTPDTKPFWDYCKKHELRMQKCSHCGYIRYPASIICPECHSMEAEWTRLSGKGKVFSFIIYVIRCSTIIGVGPIITSGVLIIKRCGVITVVTSDIAIIRIIRAPRRNHTQKRVTVTISTIVFKGFCVLNIVRTITGKTL